MAAGEGPGGVDGAAAERGREPFHDVGWPPAASIPRPRRTQRVQHVVGRGSIGGSRPEPVEVDGVPGREVLLKPQVDRHVAIAALDHCPGAGVEQRPKLQRGDGRLAERDAVAADRHLEIGERRPALLVGLERAELGAGRHDAVAKPREHRAGGHRAVERLERTPVELGDRDDARETRRSKPGRPIRRIARRRDRARFRIRHQLERLVVRERGELDRCLVGDRGDPEHRRRLVAGVRGQLVRHGARDRARRWRGGRGGHAERPTGAEYDGEDEAKQDAEREVHQYNVTGE